MKKIYFVVLLSLFSLIINSQTIENLNISGSLAEFIEVDLTVIEGYEIGYLSHSHTTVNYEINLSVCYWFTIASVVSNINNVFSIPIEPGSNDYILNVEIYNSTSQELCDFYSLTDTASIEFTTPLSQSVSFSDTEYELLIYPNPAKEILFFEVNNDIQILSISLFNMLGSKILEINNPVNELNLNEINTGVYFINIETNKGKLIKRFLKE
jgi:hypothetical protein